MTNGHSENGGCKFSVRDSLALLLTVFGIVVLFVLALRAGCCGTDASRGPGFALVTVLPVIGTWVGTVLAFYFSKENFESASKSVIASAKEAAGNSRLASVTVTAAMIPRDVLTAKSVADEKAAAALPLTVLLTSLGDKNRIPIVDVKDVPLYMIHRSAIEGGIAKAFTSRTGRAAAVDPAKLTLADLWGHDESKYRNAFGVVSAKATMADAKQEMDKVAFRQDVFVTERGTAQEPVLGLITNIEIEKQSRA